MAYSVGYGLPDYKQLPRHYFSLSDEDIKQKPQQEDVGVFLRKIIMRTFDLATNDRCIASRRLSAMVDSGTLKAGKYGFYLERT